jgi:nucleotide-binding universal stress UspA family protein
MNVNVSASAMSLKEGGAPLAPRFPPRKILFPVDFSSRCTEAGRMVETFTGHFQAQLALLYVLEPFTYNDIPVDASAASERRLAGYLADELEQFEVERVLLEGDPAVEIVDYAHRENFDLIMLPTHGYGVFRRTILGSVTSHILREASCPVWTGVHMEQVPRLEDIAFQKILCAVDLEKQSCPALDWASRFAAEFDATLEIVHAISEPNAHVTAREDLARAATAKIEAIQAAVGSKGHISVISGEAASGICGQAQREKADLLVIGRSVHEGVLGRLRANAYSIIRQSPCPVVSV